MRARAARDVRHCQVGGRHGLVGHVDAECAERAGRGEVAGVVADLARLERDGIRAVIGEVPRAAGRRDSVRGRSRRAVAVHVDAEERRVLAVTVRPRDADVAAVEIGDVDGLVVRVSDRERVRARAARDALHSEIGGRSDLVGKSHLERSQHAGLHEVPRQVGHLAGPDRDGIRAVVAKIPRAAGGCDGQRRGPRRAVAIDVDAQQRRVLAELVRPGHADVRAGDAGHVDGDVV